MNKDKNSKIHLANQFNKTAFCLYKVTQVKWIRNTCLKKNKKKIIHPVVIYCIRTHLLLLLLILLLLIQCSHLELCHSNRSVNKLF